MEYRLSKNLYIYIYICVIDFCCCWEGIGCLFIESIYHVDGGWTCEWRSEFRLLELSADWFMKLT